MNAGGVLWRVRWLVVVTCCRTSVWWGPSLFLAFWNFWKFFALICCFQFSHLIRCSAKCRPYMLVVSSMFLCFSEFHERKHVSLPSTTRAAAREIQIQLSNSQRLCDARGWACEFGLHYGQCQFTSNWNSISLCNWFHIWISMIS